MLYDRQHKVGLGDQLQVHLIELSKYNIEEGDLYRPSFWKSGYFS